MVISLGFVDSISEAYRGKLQTLSNKILAQGITENRPPSICFSGMNRETLNGIYKLRDDYVTKLSTQHTMKM